MADVYGWLEVYRIVWLSRHLGDQAGKNEVACRAILDFARKVLFVWLAQRKC